MTSPVDAVSVAMVDDLSTAAKNISNEPINAKEALMDTLDGLLERYLNMLHRYQSLQERLAKDLASGHFSLARANFSNPNRIRYGQDFYDERMQASTRFNISALAEELSVPSIVGQPREDTITVRTLTPTTKISKEKRLQNEENLLYADDDSKAELPISESLRWFGILVPPPLRASQSSFKSAVTETIPSMASISWDMGLLEIEIRRTRKKIRKAG
ncbi:MAG: hypothetical protein Q9207_002060 [Kuettlingeria erythrocarpa]